MSSIQPSSAGDIVRDQPDSACPHAFAPVPASAPRISALIQLTKPRIMLLVLVTGATALVLEGSLLTQPSRFILFLIGLFMTGGAANALNQYFELDIDARMRRTRSRRPLPLGRVSPRLALWFALVQGISGVILLGAVFNLLTAALALGTILLYSLFYTLWLKRYTPYNIVIGGIAGAMAPVGAWTAATGSTAPTPWILFLIVFLWTPPHFWSLALRFRDDYDRTGLPMMPQTKGIDGTSRQILYYSLALIPASLIYGLFGGGWPYLVSAVILGAVFVNKAWTAWTTRDDRAAWSVFTYSIFYLFGLFSSMVIDRLIR